MNILITGADGFIGSHLTKVILGILSRMKTVIDVDLLRYFDTTQQVLLDKIAKRVDDPDVIA